MSEQDDPWASALAEQADAKSTDGAEDDPWAAALTEQAETLKGNETKDKDETITLSTGPKDKVDLDVVMDVPVTLSLEIGRTKVSIRHLLSYTQGSVIELDRVAGEPMDVLINGMLIAHGEVVVVNDKFGIRLTDVVSPLERIKKLR
jgi:flagellar motor switch protein FliN/FliY